jgi:hypothetical protein
MMQYASRQGDALHIPSSDSVKRKIQDMGDNMIEEVKGMIKVCLSVASPKLRSSDPHLLGSQLPG